MSETRSVYVARMMEERISAGEFTSGDVLPQTVDLAAEYGVSANTITVAMALLAGKGLVRRVRFKGTWVE